MGDFARLPRFWLTSAICFADSVIRRKVRGICRNLAPAPVGADDGRARAFSCVVRRLGDQRGFILIELIMTMAILGLVVGGITTMLVSATKHEARLNLQFQAQESARQALIELRYDLHCASAVSLTSGTVAGTAITLSLPTGCRTGSGSVTWCTVANGIQYDLLRVPGASCTTSGSRRWAEGLVAGNNGQVCPPSSGCAVFAPAWTPQTLPDVAVDFSVAAGTSRSYRLNDVIYLRNGART